MQSIQEQSDILVQSSIDIANAYRLNGRWRDAARLLTNAMIVEATPVKLAQTKILLASIMIDWTEFTQARVLLNEAQHVAEATADEGLLTDVLYHQGDIHYYLRLLRKESSYKAAFELHLQACKQRHMIGCKQGEVDSMSRMGLLHEREGDLITAAQWYEDAIDLAHKIEYYAGTRRPLAQLGTLAWRVGDYDRAQQRYLKALAIAEEAQDYEGIMFSKGDLAQVTYAIEGDAAAAHDILQAAARMAERINHRVAMWVMTMRVADIHAEERNYSKASDGYQKAYTIAKFSDLSVLASSADIKLKAARSKAREL